MISEHFFNESRYFYIKYIKIYFSYIYINKIYYNKNKCIKIPKVNLTKEPI